MGYHKPEKAFYDSIQARVADFQVERALMIGDSLMADILGGNNANIDTAWFNPESLANTSIARPTYTIQSYSDLLRIL